MNTSRMMVFHVPDDLDVLRAIAIVSIRHAHLDHMLRMTIRTLTGVEIDEALGATASAGSSTLRKRVNKLARKELGEGAALIRLQAILERCRRATAKRNELIHNIWAREVDGNPKIRTRENTWESPPVPSDLDTLANELGNLTWEIIEARREEGFLSQALRARNPAGRN